MKVTIAALALAAAVTGCGGGGAGNELAVTHSALRPGQIKLVVQNSGEEAARIAQVILNDAFVDFRPRRRTLAPGDAETIVVPYPWIRGESYDIELMTGSGRTVGYELEDAA